MTLRHLQVRKMAPTSRALQFVFRRRSGFLRLSENDILDFSGDALGTSTSSRLEGIERSDWWGFEGRSAADASLHAACGPALLQACQKQTQSLSYGSVLVTKAGSPLRVQHILHTAVPSNPASRDPASMVADIGMPLVDNGMSMQEAESYLRMGFKSLLATAENLGCKSLCLPSIGSGCRGYAPEVSARIGVDVLLEQDRHDESHSNLEILEIRCLDRQVLQAWNRACLGQGMQTVA